MEQTLFKKAIDLNVNDKVKQKNKLNYLSWASAWSFMKTVYPDATYRIVKNEKDLEFNVGETTIYVPEHSSYHTDGRTCWVEVEITANEITQSQQLAIMDFKNQSIPLAKVNSTDVQKSIARCLAKCCALFGVALYIFEGEDLPDESKALTKIKDECMALINKKAAISETAKKKVTELCKSADKSANGDPRLIEDIEVLQKLKKDLLAIR